MLKLYQIQTFSALRLANRTGFLLLLQINCISRQRDSGCCVLVNFILRNLKWYLNERCSCCCDFSVDLARMYWKTGFTVVIQDRNVLAIQFDTVKCRGTFLSWTSAT